MRLCSEIGGGVDLTFNEVCARLSLAFVKSICSWHKQGNLIALF